MIYNAREPQRIISDHILERQRSNVWAGMGIGKTGATLDALHDLDLVESGPTLVIGPLRVAEVTWPDEVAKWDHIAGHPVSAVLGDPGARQRALKADAWLYTINNENVPWLVDHFGKGRWPFKRVVYDESTRLAGFRTRQGTLRAKALGSIAHTQVDRWINLTGTPAPNGLLGLWGQTWFVDAGERLGRNFTAYKDRWFTTIQEAGHWDKNPNYKVPIIRPAPWAQEEIETLLRDVTVSLNPKDYFALREPIVNVIKVRLPAKARGLYRDMEKRMFMELDGFDVEAVNAAAKSIKCLQVASGAAYVETGVWRDVHDVKLQALESISYEAAGAPVLAVYHWKPTLERILKAMPHARHLNDAQSIRDWNAGKIAIGVAHPKSIGHGVSLQDGGNIVAHVDQWWDFELHDQINERLGPMRQMQSGYDVWVTQHYIVVEDTLDETVLLRHATKRNVQDLLMDAMKARNYGTLS